jgi:antitoxin (DNA-binding transcriptional repressor) of toxin-antitoxin stability system
MVLIMDKINATEAARRFSDILNRVSYQGASFEIIRGNKVVARVLPAAPASPLKAEDLNQFFAGLPPLEDDDREHFAEVIESVRKGFPPEVDPWA